MCLCGQVCTAGPLELYKFLLVKCEDASCERKLGLQTHDISSDAESTWSVDTIDLAVLNSRAMQAGIGETQSPVRVAAVRALVDVLALVKSLPASDAKLITECVPS